MKVKTARVLITTECNLHCPYCCNKMSKIQKTFKMTTLDQFMQKATSYYDVINISGGEPLLAERKLINMISEISYNSDARIYLYTNGTIGPDLNYNDVYSLLDGVNVGIHDNFRTVEPRIYSWLMMLGADRVRIHVQNTKCNPEIEQFCQSVGTNMVKWKLNDCDKTPEDRFIV